MSQALTNIVPMNAFCKTGFQPAQGRHDAQRGRMIMRPATSADQKAKLSAAQLAYVAADPRWTEHRRKLAAAQEARRMTLFPNEVTAIIEMREKGRSYKYISKKIGICVEVIRRELATDPQWIEHQFRLAAVQIAPRMTLLENEVTAIVEMRKKGRNFEYIAEEIGVCRNVIRRELATRGIATERVRSNRRVRRGKGFWRSFD